MRSKRSYLSVAMIVALLLALFSPVSSAAASPKETKMQSYVSAMQPGWNLGNTFDAFNTTDPTKNDETAWGNPRVTKEFIKEIKKQGFKSIRIPITWNGRMGDAPDYKIDPAWMDRVQQVVDWSLEEGLYVMINVHHDAWMWARTMPTNHDEVLARYTAVWTQIADRFKNRSNKLMFESINEPEFLNVDITTQLAFLDEINTTFVHLVRASGGANADRPLVLPTLYCNHEKVRVDSLASTIAKLNDPNLIVTVHFYGFWPFSVNIAGYPKLEADTIKDVDTLIDNVSNAFVSKGIPVIVGEYGLLGWDAGEGVPEHGEMLKFIEYFTSKSVENKFALMLWDNGGRFDRRTLQWNDPELYNQIMASLKSRSSTGESDLIFVKKGAQEQDAVVHLNLNGNVLTSIKNGKYELVNGVDYELNGEVLTLKASYVAKLTASAEPGEVAVLKAGFNKGADWTFHVLYNDTPVLQNVEGTTSNFAIPTAFNGDRLATMEATYAAGGNAGPHNWTSFKEFNRTFKPSYATNEISLTQGFFNEVNDGTVILKFHFWSGAIIEYTITKNGTSITGTAS
ncbi:endoglucanase [Paenibacillus sp. V4I3]|uniref:cellulase family glycosylhydrolase n=1 Tax=unclassified Paenibacillus TaxID=185978 RepID=UPI002787EF79|nr:MULTISPECIES: cellulase family glycosylhydrolase [unclassified Paenibacillus]MDQ0877765.1 endoglucanase [Paenibacillus sp. V4I3]MDQ0886362.1 endoglucanase [Paenibacillus sp. V4I9]